MNAAGGRGARDSGIDTGAGGSAPIDAGPVCTFRFEVTTVTAGGLYAPHNAAAIWIETASAEFVKTLRVWSFLRNTVLIRWVASSGRSRVDAVTGATRVTHGPIDAAWNCTDTSEQEVADGAYRVCVTFAEANYVPGVSPDAGAGQPPYACFPFDKGRAAVDTTFPPEPNFTGARVSLSESR
jgi:hypothetical protein